MAQRESKFPALSILAIVLPRSSGHASVGTVVGGIIGALSIDFAETGNIAVDPTGCYTQLIFGLIFILSMVGQRFRPGGRKQ